MMCIQQNFMIAVLVLLLSGCGSSNDAPQLGQVQGIVTYQGKPLADAQVLFTPTIGPIAMGETDEKGAFRLMTRGKTGAPIGDHQVTISAYEPIKSLRVAIGAIDPQDNAKPPASRIPIKYGELKKSGLTATVKKSADNQFQFDLM